MLNYCSRLVWASCLTDVAGARGPGCVFSLGEEVIQLIRGKNTMRAAALRLWQALEQEKSKLAAKIEEIEAEQAGLKRYVPRPASMTRTHKDADTFRERVLKVLRNGGSKEGKPIRVIIDALQDTPQARASANFNGYVAATLTQMENQKLVRRNGRVRVEGYNKEVNTWKAL